MDSKQTQSAASQADAHTIFDIIAKNRTLSEHLLLVWDLLVILLVSLNLGLIIADLLFAVPPVGWALHWLWPAGHDWYERVIHSNFASIDLAFVLLFMLDVAIGWIVAIVQKRYYRWYFYPFVHWYDVLGCIPIASFRFLRVLRLISIFVRLQRLGVVEVSNWWLYRQLKIYYDIFMEEITDRVVLKALSGVQDEVTTGGSRLGRRVVHEVIAPRRELLTQAITRQTQDTITASYQANQEEIQEFIGHLVSRAMEDNPTFKQLERFPMLGHRVTEALDSAVHDTVNHVLNEAVAGLSTAEFEALISHVTATSIDRMLEQDLHDASSEFSHAAVEVLELIKKQVAIKRWHSYFE